MNMISVYDDHCITENIKRKTIHKSSYVYKRTVKKLLLYLKKTPLYEVYNVTSKEQFFGQNDATDNGTNGIDTHSFRNIELKKV